MKKEFIQAAFCAPTGEWTEKNAPSRLTDEVFGALKELGINRLFSFGMDGRKETMEKSLRLCEKYGIRYYPTLRVFDEYLRVDSDEKGKAFSELSQAELAALDAQFIADVSAWTKEPAFGGIFFMDERGYLSFEGMAHAKKVWDEHFSNWEFCFNFFSYSINDQWFWGGQGAEERKDVPFSLTGDMEILFKNRFRYYDVLVEGLLSKAHFEFLSQDKYPFECFWKEVPTSVHIGLFELNAFFSLKKRKYDSKFYNYMQAGTWEENVPRKMTQAETALQMHVTAAYGNDGFAYFPACFPLDWSGNTTERQDAAFIDIDGKTTKNWQWVKELNGFFSRIQEDVLDAEFLGVSEYGVYDNGFTEAEIADLPDNECIFRGVLPDMCRYREGSVSVTASNGLMLSVFEREAKRRYYLVNLSTVYSNTVCVNLPDGEYIVERLNETINIKDNLNITLAPGEGVYVKAL